MLSDKRRIIFYLSFGKSILDLILIVSAVVLLPDLVIAALLVRFQLGSPVFLKQIRPELHEKPFAILKFRTM